MEVEDSYWEKSELKHEILLSDMLPLHLQRCIDSIIQKEAFIQHEVISKEIPTGGGSYLGDLYDVTIKGQTKNGGGKELNIFIKNSIKTSPEFSSFLSVTKAYKAECFFYKNLSNIFTQLENDANIPKEERFKIAKGYDETTSDAIILENIAKKGYITLDRMKMIPLKFAELAVQQLAKFHSLTFVIKQKMPDYYEQNIINYESAMVVSKDWLNFYNNLMNASLKVLNDDYKKKVKAIIPQLVDAFHRFYTDDSGIRVLCHGDFRANNIMVKKSEDEITDVIAVDYQINYFGNPVNDLLYFINGCTDREFRRQHMKNLLNLYYDSMTDYLRYFDIDVTDVYPRKVFDESINKRADMGLIVALSYFTLMYAPEKNVPNFTDSIDKHQFELDAKIVRRMEEFYDELEESGHWKST